MAQRVSTISRMTVNDLDGGFGWLDSVDDIKKVAPNQVKDEQNNETVDLSEENVANEDTVSDEELNDALGELNGGIEEEEEVDAIIISPNDLNKGLVGLGEAQQVTPVYEEQQTVYEEDTDDEEYEADENDEVENLADMYAEEDDEDADLASLYADENDDDNIYEEEAVAENRVASEDEQTEGATSESELEDIYGDLEDEEGYIEDEEMYPEDEEDDAQQYNESHSEEVDDAEETDDAEDESMYPTDESTDDESLQELYGESDDDMSQLIQTALEEHSSMQSGVSNSTPNEQMPFEDNADTLDVTDDILGDSLLTDEEIQRIQQMEQRQEENIRAANSFSKNSYGSNPFGTRRNITSQFTDASGFNEDAPVNKGSDADDIRRRELELREKELELRERELKIQEAALRQGKQVQQTTQKQTTKVQTVTNKPSTSEIKAAVSEEERKRLARIKEMEQMPDEKLWRYMKYFLVKQDIANKLINNGVMIKYFGSKNVKRMVAKGYLVQFGDKLSCGKGL